MSKKRKNIKTNAKQKKLNICYNYEIAKMHYDDYVKKNRYFIDRWLNAGIEYHQRILQIVNYQLKQNAKTILNKENFPDPHIQKINKMMEEFNDEKQNV